MNEENKEKKTPELAMEIIEDYHKKNIRITQIGIADILAAEYNKTLSKGLDPTLYKEGRDVQSKVSKALKKMEKQKKVLIVENRYYIPYTEEGHRQLVKERIAKEVLFDRFDVFFVSATTVMIAVKGDDDAFQKAKELFVEYFTDKHCYDILRYDRYMVVLLKGTKSVCKQHRKEIEEIVAYAKTIQVKPPRKKKLIQNKP